MNLQGFQKKRMGKSYQENSTLGFQCVSLIKLFLQECYNFPKKKAGNANEFWYNTYNYMPTSWRKVRNDKSLINQVPPVGSILITDNLNDNNPYGHIGIVTDSGNGITFKMLQQNGGHGGGKGLGDDAILEKQYSYDYVLGRYEPPTLHVVATDEMQLLPLVSEGIRSGERPNEPCSRLEGAIMLERLFKLINK